MPSRSTADGRPRRSGHAPNIARESQSPQAPQAQRSIHAIPHALSRWALAASADEGGEHLGPPLSLQGKFSPPAHAAANKPEASSARPSFAFELLI